ncbi:MAG: hypothetical protein JKY08_07710 [Flavobacteriaceae bacterium]|nr:hypothetical protein [Flavobacteriaceae bacterium]
MTKVFYDFNGIKVTLASLTIYGTIYPINNIVSFKVVDIYEERVNWPQTGIYAAILWVIVFAVIFKLEWDYGFFISVVATIGIMSKLHPTQLEIEKHSLEITTASFIESKSILTLQAIRWHIINDTYIALGEAVEARSNTEEN